MVIFTCLAWLYLLALFTASCTILNISVFRLGEISSSTALFLLNEKSTLGELALDSRQNHCNVASTPISSNNEGRKAIEMRRTSSIAPCSLGTTFLNSSIADVALALSKLIMQFST